MSRCHSSSVPDDLTSTRPGFESPSMHFCSLCVSGMMTCCTQFYVMLHTLKGCQCDHRRGLCTQTASTRRCLAQMCTNIYIEGCANAVAVQCCKRAVVIMYV